jgi:hypothetical protein
VNERGEPASVPRFDREFFTSEERVTRIGDGSLGGKASGLLRGREAVGRLEPSATAPFTVQVPRMVVVATDVFDAFVGRNDLEGAVAAGRTDERLALAFQRAELPVEVLGDLRALVEAARTPLAVRSSSLLEDALERPFAGIYDTKMIPNNQPDADSRFRKLTEAIKLVYASTFFRAARAYRRATGADGATEKMAVIIQEVVGRRHGDRFYPHVSGVGRSYNYYPSGPARPEEGLMSLALGLGKTIVDGGRCWWYSPAHPKAPPPFGSVGQLLKESQTSFWAVNMGRPPEYDPIAETEYLLQAGLPEAEEDGTLRLVASTYDGRSDRLTPGIGAEGPRAVTFAPLLVLRQPPLNDVLRALLEACEATLGCAVEIEFALTLDADGPEIGFLQVRPMVVSGEHVEISDEDLGVPDLLLASSRAMGNGRPAGIRDVVYVKPASFEARLTTAIAGELEDVNRQLVDEGRPYLLIGFGRWGSSDPWLGIPVSWGQVSGARVIVEATVPGMEVEPSQGSHFFHNISSLGVGYLMVPHRAKPPIDWPWLEARPAHAETEHLRHVRLPRALRVEIDGRASRGAVWREGEEELST